MRKEDPTAVQAELFGATFLVVAHLTRRADAELAHLGLTTRQWLLLAVLTKGFPGHDPSLSEAAEKYGSSRQNVKQIAVGLQDLGFVRLVPDPSDGRTTRIALTDRVQEFDDPEMVERTGAMLADTFAGLSVDETRRLLRLIHKWLGTLTPPAASEAS